MKIKDKVDYLIHKYDERDPFKLAKALGVHVLFENLGKIHGYYINHSRIAIIKINKNLPIEKQIFTCFHEVGHHVLHPNANTPFLTEHTLFSTEKIETEAHAFALEFLFYNKQIITNEDLITYGIPKQVARLRKLNL
ncbi:Zn-dependent peptidase ImmA (M78 family) [Cytobacillus horneckiae]|uniref:ImmA/IrrE family metallo-endopeptidase n=1 Tax=Cytobacillus horneckiae TaxID=549687 RepID=UPI0019D095EF|nr:ImmA/IrrE family metallo-endopeptidase [Cytobacillus horneckiae]MBN6886206.1 ImmA/IrrE family metallo-endopeptidase [Cytobacillus horneckiae]